MSWKFRYLAWLKRYEQARYAYYRWKMKNSISFGADCDIYPPSIHFQGWGKVTFDDGAIVERGGFKVHFVVDWGAHVHVGKNMWIRTWYEPNVFCCGPNAYIDIGPDSMVSGIMIRVKKGVRMGKRFLGAYGSRILDSDFHELDNDTPEKSEPVEIGDYVWLTSDVTVLGGVHIGSHSVIGAGSIVTTDIPDHTFAAGRPAVPIKTIGDRSNTI